MYIGFVYRPIDGTGGVIIADTYTSLKEDVLTFKQKGKVVLFGDFNAKVGKSSVVNDVTCLGKKLVMLVVID